MEEFKEISDEVISLLRSKGFSILTWTSGYILDRYVSPKVQPMIIFNNSENFYSEFTKILVNTPLSMKRWNDCLKSNITKDGNLRWIYRVPSEIYPVDSISDLKTWWTDLKNAIINGSK